MRKSMPDLPLESPIPFRTGCNGEFVPREATELDRRAEEEWRKIVEERSRKLGISRRAFIESSAGTAAALLVINQTYGCGGGTKGTASDAAYAVDSAMTWDADAACQRLSGDEFIFDVQTHHVNPEGAWRTANPAWAFFFQSLPQGSCGESDPVDCFDLPHYAREVFINSDTAVAVLSAVPADPGENPLEAAEIQATRDAMERVASSQRIVTHGLVLPDRGAAELDAMQGLAEKMRISAWKVYTPYGGWRLDDPAIGIPFIERARTLGVKVICAHKGLPLPGFDPSFASPDDLGVVAAAYPDVKFIAYHSGWEMGVTEGPYDPAGQGIDRLIKTCLDNGIGPTGNVYAELGSTWRYLMTNPDQSQHVIGKLIQHLGPDRILWGTDSIWYGSPQDQIAAMRAFEISTAMQDQHGYPAMTAEIRAKIFGLNAAAVYGVDPQAIRCAIDEDDLAQLKRSAADRWVPRFRAYGPQTRREFFSFLRERGGRPG